MSDIQQIATAIVLGLCGLLVLIVIVRRRRCEKRFTEWAKGPQKWQTGDPLTQPLPGYTRRPQVIPDGVSTTNQGEGNV